MKKLLTALTTVLLLASCQKEISLDVPVNGGGGTGGGGTTGGNSNGDLLEKAWQITLATNDTNTITFQWDAAKRLLVYNSSGKVFGRATNINHTITRAADGKIKTIRSISDFSGTDDSTIFNFKYASGSIQLQHVTSTQFNSFSNFNDSSVFTYNTVGQVTTKETFSDLSGTFEPLSKQQYTYDALGNISKITNFQADFFTGAYALVSAATYTYDQKKAAVVFGEEAFVIFGAETISKSNLVNTVTNTGASGNTYSFTFSQFQFNTFSRPTQALLTVTPQPPGYNMRIFYFYK